MTHRPNRLAVALVLSALAAAAAAGPRPARADADAAWTQRAAGILQISVAEQHLRDDPLRFQQTVIGGMLAVGAQHCALGALEALLNRGNRRQAREACAQGLKRGAAAGAEEGYAIAVAEEAGRRQVAATRVAAEHVRRDNQRLQSFLDSSAQVLSDGRARLAAMRDAVAARRMSADDAAQALQREQRNLEAMQGSLAEARKTRDGYRQAAARFDTKGSDGDALDAQIRQMNTRIAQLESHVAQYEQALRVSRA